MRRRSASPRAFQLTFCEQTTLLAHITSNPGASAERRLSRPGTLEPGCGEIWNACEEEVMDTVTTILAGVVVAAVSSWITVQLSLRRFRAEKWWEMRVEAYKRLIEAFHDSKSFMETHLEADYEGREVPDETDEELRARAKHAAREIARAVDLGGFLLGDEVRTRLKQYQQEEARASDTESWQMYLHEDWNATNSCLQDVIRIARRDLKTNKSG